MSQASMVLGIDFDNTIVRYDGLFHRLAVERGAVSPGFPLSKAAVRNRLREMGREALWTELQGQVYGARIREADAFSGFGAFLGLCLRAGVRVVIVSHKTRYPIVGQPVDLHRAAREWLETQGILGSCESGLTDGDVFFEGDRSAKIERIRACGCTDFIDDLPEFLSESEFPAGVRRILFDPNGEYAGSEAFTILRRWEEAAGVLGLEVGSATSAVASPVPRGKRVREGMDRFLKDAGIDDGWRWEALEGGGNNRVGCIRVGERMRVLKSYFAREGDARDRFGAERAFYLWAWGMGIRRTPTPLAWDGERRYALFEFVVGRKARSEEIDPGHVVQAVGFVEELNRSRDEAASGSIPVAAEACFSLAEHEACVRRRVARLQGLEGATEIEREAVEWIATSLSPAWERARHRLKAEAGHNWDRPLVPERRCLSPSDYGFHNALISEEDGQLKFFDFEYAGWDDPAKLAVDFFFQPQIPVNVRYWRDWVGGLDDVLGWRGELVRRASLLWPVYRVKWGCILLNEFLRGGLERRRFAQGAEPVEVRRRRQLEKARRMLEGPEDGPG